MKINKYIAAAFLLVVGFSSCKNEVDDIFDEPATLRMRHMLEKTENYLKTEGSEWRMEYHPSGISNPTTFVMKFLAEQHVAMFEGDESSVSTYNLNASQGPVLTFDTYCLLHKYSDPDDTAGETLHGDFEFVIMDAQADRIELKGRKFKDRVTLVRVDDGERNRIRMERRFNPESQGGYNFYFMLQIAANTGADLFMSEDMKTATIVSSTGVSVTSPVEYTLEGFTFVTPVTVEGTTIEALAWDEETQTFKAGNVQLVGVNVPVSSRGNNVESLKNKIFDMVAVSPAMDNLFTGLSRAISNYSFSQLSLVENGNNKGMFAYVSKEVIEREELQDTTVYTWDKFFIGDYNIVAEDQISFVPMGNDGPNVNVIRRNNYGKQINDIYFANVGFTVDVRYEKLYLVSRKNSKNWLELGDASVMPVN